MKTFQPSPYQRAIYDFVEHGKGSAVVIAVAGSGKTTTIVNAASLLPQNATATFVAFNKAIATELGTRLPKQVRSQTLNSMGFGAWMRHNSSRLEVDSNKIRKVVDYCLCESDKRKYAAAIPRLVGLARSIGIVPTKSKVPIANGLTEDSDYEWKEIIDFYELSDCGSSKQLIALARHILRESIDCADRLIDFDDQLYMPVISKSTFFQNDFLFVDEAQDVNMIQRTMLRQALKRNGRLIAVGDPHQAIYGFRGADHNAIENIKAEFSAVELPLSISYRCPQSVVRLAQDYVEHIQPHEASPEGAVNRPKNFDVKQFKANDIVISRCTAGVVALAYKLLRAKIPCFVMGREIGQGLVNIIDKMKTESVDNLIVKLEDYRVRETERLLRIKQQEKIDALEDRLTTIELFIEELYESDRTVQALRNAISALFSDNQQAVAVKLMTQHKSKGLEADRVFILDFHLNERFMARASNQQKQEYNLAYVAITRARQQLTFIDSKMFNRTSK
jgi:DNA helicase II / ATP-dependent DNA helicase PcrA